MEWMKQLPLSIRWLRGSLIREHICHQTCAKWWQNPTIFSKRYLCHFWTNFSKICLIRKGIKSFNGYIYFSFFFSLFLSCKQKIRNSWPEEEWFALSSPSHFSVFSELILTNFIFPKKERNVLYAPCIEKKIGDLSYCENKQETPDLRWYNMQWQTVCINNIFPLS